MKISAIVAVAENGVIGQNNKIPWHLPSDLKFFKKTTTGHHIIMGRKCFQSIGKALPNRTNVIITRNPFFIVSNCFVVQSIPEALVLAHGHNEEESFIIGGAEIYEQTMHLWDKLYLTKVHANFEGDKFFPHVDFKEWSLAESIFKAADKNNPSDHSFNIYLRS